MVIGRCYDQVGRWNCHRSIFFMSILVLRCYTEPHPRYVTDGTCQYFLFRDGLLTQMWRASLMVHIRFWSSLPTMLKLSMLINMTRGVIVVIDWGWGLLVLFEPLCNISGGLSYILLITLHSITFVSIDDPTLFQHWILVLGGHQEVFDVDSSSENTCTPCLLQVLFTLSLSPW